MRVLAGVSSHAIVESKLHKHKLPNQHPKQEIKKTIVWQFGHIDHTLQGCSAATLCCRLGQYWECLQEDLAANADVFADMLTGTSLDLLDPDWLALSRFAIHDIEGTLDLSLSSMPDSLTTWSRY